MNTNHPDEKGFSEGSSVAQTTVFKLPGGVILEFLFRRFDIRLRSVAEIEILVNLPLLAIIPCSKTSPAKIPDAQLTESFRSLLALNARTTVSQSPRFLLVTSATPSEGKTTVAASLAYTHAQGDARVLLIDADLRRPSMHQRFGLNGKIGISTILAGTTPFKEAIQHVAGVPNLDFLSSGPTPPFPSEMLCSREMQQLYDDAAEIYTHIVIDSPPILSVIDSTILARRADATVLVIRRGKSSKRLVRRACNLFASTGAPLTGFVLNGTDV